MSELLTNGRNEGRVAPEPPFTNRGVPWTEHHAERVRRTEGVEGLTVMVDWCQLTVRGMSYVELSEKLLRIPLMLMMNDFRGGMKGGYKAFMCFDDIRVFEPSGKNKENGYQVVMSGKGCRNYEKFLEANKETWYDFLERALSYGVNFPRIDLAIDDRKPYFRIADLARLAREGKAITRMRLGDSHVGFDMGTNKKRGDTLYVGSRSSEFFICFYEKGYEQAEKLELSTVDEDWNRYELRFRQKRAVNLAKELVKRRDVAAVAMEVLNESIRFVEKPEGSEDTKIRRYPLWKPWAHFMRDIGKCKLYTMPKWKDYYDRLAWLEKQVAPTLKAYQMIDERMGTHTVGSMLERVKLDQRHLWMVDSCVNQLEAERQEGLKLEKRYRDRLELYDRGFVDYDGFHTPFDT